jgi:hypothetical protein
MNLLKKLVIFSIIIAISNFIIGNENTQSVNIFPITFNNKLLYNQKKINQIRLKNSTFKKIYLDDQDTDLDMMVYERGTDMIYIDASDNNYNLWNILLGIQNKEIS